MLIASWILFNEIAAQVINPEFDDWVEIQIGQPYIDPVGWNSNNETTFEGFASTPVDRGTDSVGYFAIISSTAAGIDASLSGMMSQTIAADKLVKIEFDSKCDTLWQTGRCIVRVLDQNDNALYTDVDSTMASEFSRRSIDIESNWTEANDSLTIQFIAKGGHDQWDEEEDGYSVFMIDKVNAEYITGIEDVEQEFEMKIFPNPANDVVHISHNLSKDPDMIEVYTLMGQRVLITNFSNEINIVSLSAGVYMLNLISIGSRHCQIIMVHNQP